MSNSQKMRLFSDKMDNLISEMEKALELMPIKGNCISDCQRTYLQQKINELSHAVNGVDVVDFDEELQPMR
jgi:hypothetical protein